MTTEARRLTKSHRLTKAGGGRKATLQRVEKRRAVLPSCPASWTALGTLFLSSVRVNSTLLLCPQGKEHPVRSLLVVFAALATVAAHAEVLTLEGTIKSVDASKRELTIGRKTLDVAKKCRITVDGKNAEIGDLKADQEATVEYDSDLEVAKSIAIASETQTSTATTDADLSAEEKKLVGDWKSKSSKEGKSFDATRVIREWNNDGKEFNRGVWLVRKDGTFLAAFRNKYSIEGQLVSEDSIEFTVFDQQHRVVEKLQMKRAD